MKHLTAKRFGAALVAAALTLNVAAVGNMTVMAEEMEAVTIDIFMDSSGENTMSAGIQEDPVAQYIKEQTGVTMNVVLFSEEKQQAMAASGDLYDLTRINLQYVTPLIQAGAVHSLDEYFTYAPNMVEDFSGMVNYSKEYLSNGEGKMYAICARGKSVPSPIATSRYGNFLSWEHYKEAGSPEIHTLDELLALMQTIQSNHPETESGKKTYAFSGFNNWGLTHALSTPIIWKYCAQYPLNDLSAFDLTSLEYVDLYDENHMYWQKAAMNFKANQMGILDPECYTQKNEEYAQKINEGQVLSSAMEWDFDLINADLKANGGADQFVDVLWADTEEIPVWVDRASEFGMSGRTFVVSSRCDEAKMKGIMRLLNFVFSEDGARTIMNGPKGITWDYDENGVAVFTEDCKQKMAENPAYLAEQGAKRYLGITGYDYDALAISEANTGSYIDLTLSTDYIKENMSATEKDYCEFYGVDIPIEAATKRENKSTICEGYINLMPAEDPTSIKRSATKISDYLLQAIPAMVFSETQEEYDQKFAEIQEELKKMNYDEVTEYYKEAWENAQATYDVLTAK